MNGACQATKPCVVRDYRPSWGRAADGAPLIFALPTERAIDLDNGGEARHEEGYLFANLDLQGQGSGWGIFIYNDIDDVTMCNLTINNFSIGVHLGGPTTATRGSDGANDRITLRSSRITNNGSQGWLGTNSETSIEDSIFDNNGFEQAVLNHNIYLSAHAVAKNIRVVGNKLFHSAVVNGKCGGTSMVIHGRVENLRIEDNIIKEEIEKADPGCWGIGVVTGYDTPESFTNVVIRRNAILNMGNNSIALNACQNCAVENNVIVNEQNINSSAITVSGRSNQKGDTPNASVVIRNNSLYIDRGTAITLEREGTDHVVTGNAILSSERQPSICFQLSLPRQAYRAVDHNVCDPGRNGRWTGAFDSLASWSRETGFDRQSAQTDPGFVSTLTARYDLAPRDGSPLINRAGPSESPPDDKTGKVRSDGAPDIGAIER